MAQKFEVGDKVIIAKMDIHWPDYCGSLNKFIGKTAVVEDIGKESIRLRIIDTDVIGYMCSDTWYFNPDWLELVEKANKYYTGKVICTKFQEDYRSKYYDVKFTPGKVYTICNGTLLDDIVSPAPYRMGIKNMDDVNAENYVDVEFIEFKGYVEEGKDKNA